MNTLLNCRVTLLLLLVLTTATGLLTAQEKKPARPDVPVGDADLLQNVPIGPVVTNAALAEADRAWKEVLQSMRPPPYPPEWNTTPPSKEALAEYERKNSVLAGEAAGRMKDFYTKYPKHEMAGEAKDRELYLLGVAWQLGNSNVLRRLQEVEEGKLKDPGLSEEERLQLRVNQVQRSLSNRDGSDTAATLVKLEKGARDLIKEFPKRPELSAILLNVAQGWLDQGNLERARKLAQELAGGSLPMDVETGAKGLLKKIDRIGKPLAIKFKAIDGRAIDLAAMKGKVVLVDFWATWCVPCMAELPNVKAAYEKLKPKGFEIVGISLDRDQEALEKVVSREGMTWPQHFDAGSEGKFAEEFDIAAIPTMWLVDKKGNLRELNARENLIGKVEKLLAE